MKYSLTCLWRWNRMRVPKLRQLELRRRGITQKGRNYSACIVFLLLPVTLCTKWITGRYLTCDTKYWRYLKILVCSYRPIVEVSSRALYGIRGPMSPSNRHTFFIIIINHSRSRATCWPVPVSRIQKSLQRSTMIPSASWGVVFHYPE